MTIAKRRGVWVVDYRDVDSIRRTPSFESYEAAEEWARVHVPSRAQRRRRRTAGGEPGLTFGAWAATWLARIAPPTLKPRAYEAHADAMRRHLVPAPGTARLPAARR